MAFPSLTTIRSYGGSVPPAYITTDVPAYYIAGQSITASSLAGWYEVSATGQATTNPLGTSGPFVITLNPGAINEERILCSSVSIANLYIVVWTDGVNNGRGYDGNIISTHYHQTTQVKVNDIYHGASATESLQFNRGVQQAITTANSALSYVQGLTGPQGPQGVVGSQGNQGAGTQGVQGPQGSSTGTQGYQGAPGPQGPQGTTGLQGNQGNQGNQGVTGAGTQGNQGAAGSTGLQGNQGYQGNQGFQGVSVQGPQGNQGNAGTQGTQGNQGASVQGPQGTTGATGSQGFQGNQGFAGTGTQGSQGFQGNQGTAGTNGTNGSQGTQGNQGNQGTAGTNGTTGSQGNQGFQGLQGNQGFQGFQGNQGNQGNQGSTPTTYVSTFAGGTTGLTPAAATSGVVSLAGTLAVANGGTGVTTATGSGSNVLSTNPTIVAPFETVLISATALSGSTAASIALGSEAVFLYTGNPTATWALNVTGAPTTTGQSATVAIGVINGATAYLPSNITINTVQAGASSSVLPVQGATNNSITSYYQGGTAWSAADASTLDFYTITIICTGSSAWTLLLGQTKF